MRTALLLALAGFLAPFFASFPALGAPQDAVGVWLTNRQAVIEIQPCGESLCGRLFWYVEKRTGSDAGRDSKNPSPKNRSRPLCGLTLLGGFQPNATGWENGWIYDPRSGNTYSGTMEPDGPDRLKLRGYVGISLLGRTEVWTRAPADQKRCDE